LHALVDGKKIIITESSVRRDLQLADENGIDCLPNSTIFKQPALMGKPKRKDTKVPQPSDPTKSVANEAVYKELGDSLVRVATTASSLEAEQDSDNINKTQSKATPNESSSLGTTLGGGPRCQETTGDTIAQTRLKLDQHNEIASLKRRVKKLEKKNRSRTHKLKKLYKVGLTARVESSGDKESLGEDASKQGRIDAIDADEEITLEVFAAEQEVAANKEVNDEVNVVEEVVEDVSQVSAAGNVVSTTGDATIAKIDVDHQLAERLQVQEQEELSVEEKATLFQQLLKKRRKHFTAKRAEEKRNKPPTKAQQRKIMCTYLKNMEGYKLKDLKLKEFDSIQEMFDRAFKRVNTFEDFRTELVEGKEKRAGTELIQENTKKQKVEDDKETAELKQLMKIIPDEKEVAIDVIPLAVKSPSIIYMLVEKKYPLTPSTLSMMFEKKLIIDYESEMAYQLLKFIMKQLKK
ncbi:hypothetical protein Tco_0751319, partial [Tanacetum coccineum]